MTTTKAGFQQYSLDTAPAASKEALIKLKEAVGMVPNLAGVMSASPLLITAFEGLRSTCHAMNPLSQMELEMVMLTNASTNGCSYCQAIHSAFGANAGISSEDIKAIRSGGAPNEPKSHALVTFTRAILEHRGRIPQEIEDEFLSQGYSKADALSMLALSALSLIANYSARMAQPELDEAIQAYA